MFSELVIKYKYRVNAAPVQLQTGALAANVVTMVALLVCWFFCN
jgi:hypothetical protein